MGWDRLINQEQMDEIDENIDIIEEHIHNSDIWIGNNAGSGEEDNLTPFRLTSGNNDFGAAVPLLAAGDTPLRAGALSFDFRKIGLTALDQATAYYIRFIWGTGTSAAAEAAFQYTTEFIIRIAPGAVAKGCPIEIEFPRLATGTKIWAKCKNATNLATLDFTFSVHQYDNGVT